MRFLLAGASGMLGTALRTRLLREGHEVTRLVRGEPSGPDQRRWDPYADDLDLAIDRSVLEGIDVAVNLGGTPLVGNPHSARYRRNVLQSRVATTRTMAGAVARAAAEGNPPSFLAGNGIAYYGDRGNEVLTEDSGSRGDSLLTRVTRQWQEATEPAERAGARVVVLRTPPVLDRSSGVLRLILPIFRLGLGGPLGPGSQYFPVVSLPDWVSAVVHLATNETSTGPYNLTIPEPPTNAEFTEALGRLLHRPTVLRIPSFVLDKAAGQLSPELLGSVRAIPAKLTADGFTFAHSSVDEVLAVALG